MFKRYRFIVQFFTDQWNDKQCIDFKKSFGDHFHQGFVTKVDLEAKKIFIGNDQESPLEFTDVVFAVGKYLVRNT